MLFFMEIWNHFFWLNKKILSKVPISNSQERIVLNNNQFFFLRLQSTFAIKSKSIYIFSTECCNEEIDWSIKSLISHRQLLKYSTIISRIFVDGYLILPMRISFITTYFINFGVRFLIIKEYIYIIINIIPKIKVYWNSKFH